MKLSDFHSNYLFQIYEIICRQKERKEQLEKKIRVGRTDINSWEKGISSWRKSKTLKNPNMTLVDGDIFLNIKNESGKDGIPIEEGTNRFTK